MARSWHEQEWGRRVDVLDAQEWDIVVFGKPGGIFGHAAFYIEGDADVASCLGGGQLKTVRIRRYEFTRRIGLTLLSIRRPIT